MTLERTTWFHIAACALLGAAAASCDSASDPPVPVAASIVAGDAQSGVAGMALAVAPGIRVEDARGKGVAGVPVVFEIVEGGGAVEHDSVATDRDGLASPGAWTLGPQVGPNTLVATAAGLPAVSFTATSSPGAPAILRVQAGADQSVTVGERVAVPPTVVVLDANENPVPGVSVTFTIVEGDGVVIGGGTESSADASSITLATGDDGLASPASWQLGTVAGTNTLEAHIVGLPISATFVATGEPGPAADLVASAGTGQSAPVAVAVPVAPAVTVRDAWGNVVPGTPVTFSVVAGDGDVTAPGDTTPSSLVIVETDDAGIARLGSWRLGTQAGNNSVEAGIPGVGAVVRFAAIGAPGPANEILIVAGDGQSAPAGSRLPVAPAVRVTDAYGNAVPGLVVRFEVTGGGGAIAGAIVMTASDGIAAVESWELGLAPGPNSLSATADTLAPITFDATGIATSGGSGGSGSTGSGFGIDLRYTTSIPSAQTDAFSAAADRWAGVITGDLPDVYVSLAANACGAPHPALDETIDDVVVFITVTPIDGPGKILGSAGPCRIRAGGLPAVGIIYLDSDDVGNLLSSGLLTDVVFHEMGHVLGIGTLWSAAVTSGIGTADPIFTGAHAVSEFIAAGGYGYAGTPVPVENTGGAGTRDAHWRESVMTNEIMTGWINYGGNPLSGVTIGSLADIGYQVDYNAAGAWRVSDITTLQTDTTRGFEILEGMLPPPIVVGSGADATSAAKPATARGIARSAGSTPR